MQYEVEPIIIDTNGLTFPGLLETPEEILDANYQIYDRDETPKCSIAVIGYQRFEKTQYCVECILKYTRDIDYELILVDGGSADGTSEFFQAVAYPNKKIIQVTQNMGMNFLWPILQRTFNGKYLIVISNDIYVTRNWLSNLLTCYESDPKIGFVEPICSNVSNNQQVNLSYRSLDEMQEKAAEINQSDPSKWEERLRLVSPIVLYSRPILDIVGVYDPAFIHDYADDDYSARIRRAGYKLILCRDTWVCHDHEYGDIGAKAPVAFQRGLSYGSQLYREKYHGLDPWSDFNNYEPILLSPLDTVQLPPDDLSVLTVDVCCGAPMLEIRNRLRRRNRVCGDCQAFTTQAKYYHDLQTVCDDVCCDRIDYIQSHYDQNSFDIIVLGQPLNTYPAPTGLLQMLYNLLKPGGTFLFKLRNTDDFNTLLRAGGLGGQHNPEMSAPLSYYETTEKLKGFGAYDVSIVYETASLPPDEQNRLFSLLQSIKPDSEHADLIRILTQYYYFKVVK
ncbi:MAG: glycosyltransferase [Lachnospiraceae bacterium]